MTTPNLSFLKVYTRDGQCCDVAMYEVERLESVMVRFLCGASTPPALIALATPDGGTYSVLLSEITGWLDSTPETRAARAERVAAIDAETQPDWSHG